MEQNSLYRALTNVKLSMKITREMRAVGCSDDHIVRFGRKLTVFLWVVNFPEMKAEFQYQLNEGESHENTTYQSLNDIYLVLTNSYL